MEPEGMDGVQPADAGQGGDDSDIFGGYEVPDEHKPFAEGYRKHIDGNVGRKFQEHADYRARLEPYEKLGIGDIPPEQLGEILNWYRGVSGSEEAFENWWKQVGAEHLGYDFGEDGEPVAETGEPAAVEDPLESMRELLSQEIGPLKEHFQQAKTQEQVDQDAAKAGEALDALREEHGDFNELLVLKVANSPEYHELPVDQAIQQAFNDVAESNAAYERSFVEGKLGQPAPAERGGRPANEYEEAQSFADAGSRLRERIAAANAANAGA